MIDQPSATTGPALHAIEVALEAAQSCILGETPEVGTPEDARDWTLEAIRDALLTHLPAVRSALS